MSASPETAKVAPAPGGARPLAAPGRAEALSDRLGARLANEWLPRAAWTIRRTGRPGLAGIALLLAAALFLLSTHLKVVAEVEALRADIEAARGRERAPAEETVPDPAGGAHALPSRADVPDLLRQLFQVATKAKLAVDTAKYEVSAMSAGGVVRTQVTFPLDGPYPQIRAFIDEALATMPAVALSGLALERKAIGDGNVEAQIRMTLYTRSAP